MATQVTIRAGEAFPMSDDYLNGMKRTIKVVPFRRDVYPYLQVEVEVDTTTFYLNGAELTDNGDEWVVDLEGDVDGILLEISHHVEGPIEAEYDGLTKTFSQGRVV